MRIVGIDTSTFTGGIALLDNGQIVAEHNAYVTRKNSEGLMGVLHRMLHDLDWNAKDIEGISVAIGPGSFTGIRIGVTMAKVLGYSLNIPIGRVVTLDVIAANISFSKSLICPLICARRDIVYNAVYRGNGLHPKKVVDYNVGEIEKVIDSIKSTGDINNGVYDKIIFLGNGAIQHKGTIEKNLEGLATFGYPWHLGPRPGVVAVLGEYQIKKGNVVGAHELTPFYMGRSSAENLRKSNA